MTRYVLGFLFDQDRDRVVLIRKNRPDWMKGKWNAIGGKARENEGIHDAMIRECEEEAGIVNTSKWLLFASTTGDGFDIFCYRATTSDIMEAHGREIEGELVIVSRVDRIVDHPLVPDLRWLIYAAITHFHYPHNFIEVLRTGNPHLTINDKEASETEAEVPTP